MAPRPAWRGYLKLSLVTCAVQLASATTSAEKISFRMLNRKTGHRLKRQYVDATTGKPVADKDEVKGYEIDKDEFLLIEEDEIDAVQIESSHTLDLTTFVARDEIDEIYLDTPYYLTPADEVSQEAFAVIREALAKKKMAGLARIVLYRREKPAVIEPFGKGMMLTTLRYGGTVRDAEDAFDGLDTKKVDKQMLALATKVIDVNTGAFEPEKLEDDYEKSLIALIRQRKKGGAKLAPRPAADKPKADNVVNLFDALKKSLASDGADKGKQTKKPAARKGK